MINKIKFKYRKKRFSNTITYKLLMNLDMFFNLFCLILIALYTIGNYQSFLDKSQQIILNTLAISSIFTVLLSFVLFLETFIKIFTEKNKIKNVLNLIYLLVTIVFCVICIVIATAIDYISLGG